MRKRLLLAVVAMSLMFVVPADAQTELDRARSSVTASTERLETFLDDLNATQQRGDDLAQQYWQVQSGLEKLELDIMASEASATELAGQISGLRDQVRVIAVDQYVSHNEYMGVGDYASEADRAAAEALARLVVGTNNAAIDQLAVIDAEYERVRSDLEKQRSEQLETLAEVEATQAQIVGELDRLALLKAAVVAELDEVEAALDELEQAESERQAEAAESARIAEERTRAEAAAAAAARLARQPVIPTATPVPNPQLPDATATAVPNPQLPDATATSVPNPQLPDATATSVPNPQLPDATATAIPNPQLPDAAATSVPNPQLPDATATAIPNPQLPDAAATSVPNPQLPDAAATAIPNPQPSEPFPTATAVPNPQPDTTTVSSGGGLVCPLAGAFTHTDDFNSPRAVGGVHRANDLISATGTPVLAVAAGMVEHRDSSVGGMSAHLKGDNGDYYFYTHMSAYENVGAGHVEAGTVIGYVGETGNAPIPHLHFEIHSGGYGNYTNPYGPVRAACF